MLPLRAGNFSHHKMKSFDNRLVWRTGLTAIESPAITVATAILTAGLRSALASPKRIACLNRLHQAGVAHSTSAGDNKNVLIEAGKMRCIPGCSPDRRERCFYQAVSEACMQLEQPPT
jgi:hypothetical protein